MVSHYARAYTFVSYVVKSSKICNDMQRLTVIQSSWLFPLQTIHQQE